MVRLKSSSNSPLTTLATRSSSRTMVYTRANSRCGGRGGIRGLQPACTCACAWHGMTCRVTAWHGESKHACKKWHDMPWHPSREACAQVWPGLPAKPQQSSVRVPPARLPIPVRIFIALDHSTWPWEWWDAQPFTVPISMRNNSVLNTPARFPTGQPWLCNKKVGVLNWFAKLWEIDEEEYWGYITTCGTEGNLHGILVGRENHPDGILYASSETHYSVFKAGRMYRMDTVKVGARSWIGQLGGGGLECSMVCVGQLCVCGGGAKQGAWGVETQGRGPALAVGVSTVQASLFSATVSVQIVSF
eukprot:350436-Chlamydomonas_euryale.AAC.12